MNKLQLLISICKQLEDWKIYLIMLKQTTIIHFDKYNEFDLFEDIKYTLDEEFLDEFIKKLKRTITD